MAMVTPVPGPVKLALGALVAATALLAVAGAAAAQQKDPLACITRPGFDQVKLGDAVFDSRGRRIGWVSVSQCNEPSGERLKIWLDPAQGGDHMTTPLDGVKVEARGLVLPLRAEDLAEAAQPTAKQVRPS